MQVKKLMRASKPCELAQLTVRNTRDVALRTDCRESRWDAASRAEAPALAQVARSRAVPRQVVVAPAARGHAQVVSQRRAPGSALPDAAR